MRIKSIFDITNGFTPLRSEPKFWENGDINWFTVDDIRKQGKIIKSTIVKINNCACSQDRIVKENSFLLCCTASVGEYCLTRIPLTTNQQFNALTLKAFSKNCYSMEFILSIGGYFKNILLSIAGKTTFPFISTKKLGELFLPLPPLEEQNGILNKISSVEYFIRSYDSLERQLTKLETEFPEKLKKSILQYAIEGKLVKQDPNDEPASVLLERIKTEKEKLIKEGKIKREKNESCIYQGDDKNYYEKIGKNIENITNSIPFDLPINWSYSKLCNVGYLIRGNGIKRDETTSEGFPCVRYGELYTTYKKSFYETKSFTNEEVFNKSQKINKFDIIMALTGENKTDIATAVVYYGEEPVAIGGDMTKWSNHFMNSTYLTYIINSNYGMINRRKLASGDIIVHISNDKLGSIILPIPPLYEQSRIVQKVEMLFNKLK